MELSIKYSSRKRQNFSHFLSQKLQKIAIFREFTLPGFRICIFRVRFAQFHFLGSGLRESRGFWVYRVFQVRVPTSNVYVSWTKTHSLSHKTLNQKYHIVTRNLSILYKRRYFIFISYVPFIQYQSSKVLFVKFLPPKND